MPKTAAGFNRDFKALKKNTETQLTYLKRIPTATMNGYFVKTELETETFAEILRTLSEKVTSTDDCTWAHNFMMGMSKSFKFDMTIMFIEDEEIDYISTIVGKIRAVDAGKADQVKAAYDD